MLIRAQAIPTKLILALHATHVATTAILLDHHATAGARSSHHQFAQVAHTGFTVFRHASPLSCKENPVRNLLERIFPSGSTLWALERCFAFDPPRVAVNLHQSCVAALRIWTVPHLVTVDQVMAHLKVCELGHPLFCLYSLLLSHDE